MEKEPRRASPRQRADSQHFKFAPRFLTREEVLANYLAALKQIETKLLEAHLNMKLHPEDARYVKQYEELIKQIEIAEAQYREQE